VAKKNKNVLKLQGALKISREMIIYNSPDGEIEEKRNVQNLHISSTKPTKFYNLDCILAVGYRTNSHRAIMFRKWATNILHWAISHQTAAEIIYNRANAQKDHMGLTTWKNAPDGLIRKTDVSVAKNYLNEKEMTSLNRIVSMYLDYAEEQAQNHQVMYMEDWVKKLDAFLKFNQKDILTDFGKVSHEIAKAFAEASIFQWQ